MGAIVGVGMSRDVHGTARHEVTCPFGTHPKDASLSQRARTTSEAARGIRTCPGNGDARGEGFAALTMRQLKLGMGCCPAVGQGSGWQRQKESLESTLYLLAFCSIVANLHRAPCKPLAPRVGRGFRVL